MNKINIGYNDINMLKNITLAKKYWKVPWYCNLDNIYQNSHSTKVLSSTFLQVKYVFRHAKCWPISLNFHGGSMVHFNKFL